MAAKSGGGPSSGLRGIRPGASEIGPHNFKDHFDRDIIDYVREDVRLSTLQRKLVRENNTLVSHALACQVSKCFAKRSKNSHFTLSTQCKKLRM